MANNKAAEFLSKVLSDEALRARLADMAPAQAAEAAAELGYEVTEEELIEAKECWTTASFARRAGWIFCSPSSSTRPILHVTAERYTGLSPENAICNADIALCQRPPESTEVPLMRRSSV